LSGVCRLKMRPIHCAADHLRANSDLKASEVSTPVLGLIFLKFAGNNYRRHEAAILAERRRIKRTRREKKIPEIAVATCGFYLPDENDIAKALPKQLLRTFANIPADATGDSTRQQGVHSPCGSARYNQ